MAPIPRPRASTVAAIYAAYEAANEQRDGKTIPVSQLAEECARKLWFDFRWTTPHEDIPGRSRDVLLRIACGEDLGEVASDYGISRERVRQIADAERARLRKALNTVKVAA